MLRVFRFIDNLSIFKKFVWLYVLCVILPLVVTQSFVLSAATAEIRAREQQNAEMSLNRARTTVEYQFYAAMALANAVATDTQINDGVRRLYDQPNAYYVSYYDRLRPKLNGYLLSYAQQVSGIELYVENPTLLSGGLIMRLTGEVRGEPWYRTDQGEVTRVVGYARRALSGTNAPQISVVRTLEGSRDGVERLVKIDLTMTPIHRSLYQEREYMHLYLVDGSGAVLSHTGSFLDPPGSLLEVLPDSLDLQVPIGSQTGWHLLAVVKGEALRASVICTVLTSLLVASLVSVFAGAAAFVIAESFLRRSRRLLRNLDAVGHGQFDSIDGEIGNDEIGELIHHYNDTSARLRQLIDDVYQLGAQKESLELERVRAELKYLQAQVDPHFLFNTLNALLVMSAKNHYDEITPVIRSLAKILRRMADTSDDLVPLSVELDFTRMYLEIMRFRFGEKLDYRIRAVDDIAQVPLPQMSIQALAENACKHGIEHSETGQGFISIEVRSDGGAVLITVHDNGTGIDPERLADIRQNLSERKAQSGNIGLANISRRLALYYAGAAQLTIESEPGSGATVTMRIPSAPAGGEVHV